MANASGAAQAIFGLATAASLGMAETAMGDTIGLVMHNAVTAERNMQTTANAAIAIVCALIIAKGAAPSQPG